MKPNKFCVLAGVLLLVFLLTASASIPTAMAAQKTIKLTFSGIFPMAHLHSKLNQLFCDEITKRTNGRVEITFYPGGTLVSAVKNFEGVVKGMTDIGMSCPLYVPGRFPVSEIFELPSRLDDGWVTAKVYADLYHQFDLKEYKDVHVLYFHGPSHNIISTRTVPVHRLEDLRGMVLRASGGATSTVTAFGATPRAMHMGEAYAALSKGVVEGQFSAPESLIGWKHAEVVKYASIPPVSTSSCQYAVMNKRKWNSLPDDIQKIFTELSANFGAYHGYIWNYLDKKGFDFLMSLPDREIIAIPADQRPQWEAAVKPVIDKYIKEKTAMGLPAQAYWDYFNERIEYWSARKPTFEEAAQWVEANLIKE